MIRRNVKLSVLFKFQDYCFVKKKQYASNLPKYFTGNIQTHLESQSLS